MVALVLTLVVALVAVGDGAAQPGGPPFEDAELRAVMARVRSRPYDRIPAIDYPEFTSADSAGQFLRPLDEVIGIGEGRQARAYPVAFLNGREVVNDRLGKTPVAVTW